MRMDGWVSGGYPTLVVAFCSMFDDNSFTDDEGACFCKLKLHLKLKLKMNMKIKLNTNPLLLQ